MMDLEMTFQLARDLMAADSVEMIQRETIKFIESRLGQPAAIALLPGSTREEAQIAASRLREAIAQTTLLHQGVSIKLQISVGITEYEMNESPEDILERADHAMYEDKRSRKMTRDVEESNVVALSVPRILPELRRHAARFDQQLSH